ncbi:hypothetical protein [Halorubellus litoreus]|uniref:Uncharacterized protein n=1 Tax=Halorubellus litoreus TaxID=755308 RepID=A0ABD5VFJ5_9EURY
MQLPSIDEFLELRRLLCVLAAVLFVGALAFPMWTIEVHAVQYPNTVLRVELFAYPHVAGDYVEMARLNKYIGFYYPDPVLVEPNFEVHENAVRVPEWSLGPVAFVGCALAGVFVAVAPTERKLRAGLLAQVVGTVGVFGAMVADIQYRLYQVGHSLDPNAPVMGVDGFTPPLFGQYSVANITSYSRFGLGAYLSMVAIAVLVLAYRYRDSTATPRDLVVAAGTARPVLGTLKLLPVVDYPPEAPGSDSSADGRAPGSGDEPVAVDGFGDGEDPERVERPTGRRPRDADGAPGRDRGGRGGVGGD